MSLYAPRGPSDGKYFNLAIILPRQRARYIAFDSEAKLRNWYEKILIEMYTLETIFRWRVAEDAQ